MTCSNISPPVTFQQSYTSVVAAPQSLLVRKRWRCAQLWRLARPVGRHQRRVKDRRHAFVEIVSKHALHHAARAAWAIQSCSPFMQDKHCDDILEATKSFVQSADFHPDLSTHPDQTFRLGLIRHLLQLMHDRDTGLIDIAGSGFQTGAFEPIQIPGIWRRQQSLKSTTRTGSRPRKTPTRVSPHPRRHRRQVLFKSSTPLSKRKRTVRTRALPFPLLI